MSSLFESTIKPVKKASKSATTQVRFNLRLGNKSIRSTNERDIADMFRKVQAILQENKVLRRSLEESRKKVGMLEEGRRKDRQVTEQALPEVKRWMQMACEHSKAVFACQSRALGLLLDVVTASLDHEPSQDSDKDDSADIGERNAPEEPQAPASPQDDDDNMSSSVHTAADMELEETKSYQPAACSGKGSAHKITDMDWLSLEFLRQQAPVVPPVKSDASLLRAEYCNYAPAGAGTRGQKTSTPASTAVHELKEAASLQISPVTLGPKVAVSNARKNWPTVIQPGAETSTSSPRAETAHDQTHDHFIRELLRKVTRAGKARHEPLFSDESSLGWASLIGRPRDKADEDATGGSGPEGVSEADRAKQQESRRQPPTAAGSSDIEEAKQASSGVTERDEVASTSGLACVKPVAPPVAESDALAAVATGSSMPTKTKKKKKSTRRTAAPPSSIVTRSASRRPVRAASLGKNYNETSAPEELRKP